jgi:hypothetical protein
MPGFLIDHDVDFARKWFPGNVADGKWSDPEVVAKAWDDTSTIVTANGGDLAREVLKYQRTHPCTKSECHDMFGLVVIPNHEFRARNAIEAVAKKRGLRAGLTTLTMDDIHMHNLYAKYHADGSVEVKRFPMCPYRDDGDLPAWFTALKIVGG